MVAKRITQSLPKTVHATFPSFRLLTHFVESVGRKDVLGLVLKSWLSKIHPTKGWDYDLGHVAQIFSVIMVWGGLLGTQLEGIPPLNPQGALSGGRVES